MLWPRAAYNTIDLDVVATSRNAVMTNIVNLRRARKLKQRSGKEQTAAENRARYGRTKADRQQLDAQAHLDARRLDGAKRGEGSEGGDKP
jgi:hypothetical protein